MHMTKETVRDTDLPAFCVGCESRRQGICGAMTNAELERLSRHARRRDASPGEELMGETTLATSYAKIISGVVKLSKMIVDGRQQIVGLQFGGDFIGRPFVPNNLVTTEAATPVRMCIFPKTVVDLLMRETPELEHRLYEQSLDQLDDAREWLMTLGRKTAGERVASFLLMIALRTNPGQGCSGAIAFDLPMKREDIADYLGLTVETISRQLTKLRKTGIISIEASRHVRVPDLQRLAHHAGI